MSQQFSFSTGFRQVNEAFYFKKKKKKKKDTTNFSSVHPLLSLTSKFKQSRNVYPGLVFANLTSCREEFVYLCLYKYIKFDLEIKSIKNSMRKKKKCNITQSFRSRTSNMTQCRNTRSHVPLSPAGHTSFWHHGTKDRQRCSNFNNLRSCRLYFRFAVKIQGHPMRIQFKTT